MTDTSPTPDLPHPPSAGAPAAGRPPPSWPQLDAVEARVLGALLEKSLATPEYYPLTMSALIAACNQKNNRDPVVQFGEQETLDALDGLREKKAAWLVTLAGSRVAKYRHAFTDVFHVADDAVPLFCELLLRGPQTAAELRARCERLGLTVDTAAVEAALQELIDHREGPFVARLPREPGRRECRYAQLLSGPPPAAAVAPPPAPGLLSLPTPTSERLAALEAHCAALAARVAALEAALGVASPADTPGAPP